MYFQVDTLPDYGKLSHRTLDELLESAGARVEVDERKRAPVDFALWKAAKPGEPEWDSPWGPGRPGLAHRVLGDVARASSASVRHPRRRRPISSSRTTRTRSRSPRAPGHDSRAHWLHNGMVNVDGEKMSKSLGNFTTLADVLDQCDPRAFRLLVLQTHYRRQMEIGEKELRDAEKAVERLDTFVRRAGARPARSEGRCRRPRRRSGPRWTTTSTRRPRSASCSSWCATRTSRSTSERPTMPRAWSPRCAKSPARSASHRRQRAELDDEIADLVTARRPCAERRDFAEADRIRDELRHGIASEPRAGSRSTTSWPQRSIVVEDTPVGPSGAVSGRGQQRSELGGDQVEGRRCGARAACGPKRRPCAPCTVERGTSTTT